MDAAFQKAEILLFREAFSRRRGIFTCCDENFDEPTFIRFMEAEFGRPSRYEKG